MPFHFGTKMIFKINIQIKPARALLCPVDMDWKCHWLTPFHAFVVVSGFFSHNLFKKFFQENSRLCYRLTAGAQNSLLERKWLSQ